MFLIHNLSQFSFFTSIVKKYTTIIIPFPSSSEKMFPVTTKPHEMCPEENVLFYANHTYHYSKTSIIRQPMKEFGLNSEVVLEQN